MGPEDELYSSEEEEDDTWMNKSAKNILTPAMQERCSSRHEFRIKIMVYYKQCQLECSYEKATSYLFDYLIGHDDIEYTPDKKYLVNSRLKIGLYVKGLRTGNSFGKRIPNSAVAAKVRNSTAIENIFSVTTASSLFKEIYKFYSMKPGYKLMIIGGTD